MPIHRVIRDGKPVGWQWGQSGTVYRTRAEAIAQARAIWASGYKERKKR